MIEQLAIRYDNDIFRATNHVGIIKGRIKLVKYFLFNINCTFLCIKIWLGRVWKHDEFRFIFTTRIYVPIRDIKIASNYHATIKHMPIKLRPEDHLPFSFSKKYRCFFPCAIARKISISINNWVANCRRCEHIKSNLCVVYLILMHIGILVCLGVVWVVRRCWPELAKKWRKARG